MVNNIRKWMHGIQWVNVATIVAQLTAVASNVAPANPWILGINALLAAVLPGLGGVDHLAAGTKVVPK